MMLHRRAALWPSQKRSKTQESTQGKPADLPSCRCTRCMTRKNRPIKLDTTLGSASYLRTHAQRQGSSGNSFPFAYIPWPHARECFRKRTGHQNRKFVFLNFVFKQKRITVHGRSNLTLLDAPFKCVLTFNTF